MNENKLKGLQSQLKRLKTDFDIAKSECKQKQQKLSLLDTQIKDLELKIKNLNENKELIISEHAILRYLERVKGLDLNAIKEEILSDEIKSVVDVIGGTCKVPNKNFKLIIQDYIVTTIIN